VPAGSVSPARAGAAMAVLVFALDQLSKYWVLHVIDLPAVGSIAVLPVFNLSMVWNQGVTFGLLNGGGAGPVVLALVALAVVFALGLWLRRAERLLIGLALGAILGGALGNVLDRLRYGAVVDFLHFHIGPYSWYVFNLGDAAIVCGVAALVLDGVLPHRSAGTVRQ
jgi:signal peptidase II